MISLRIRGFLLDRENMPIVVLADETGRLTLPVWIGPAEASAIIVELEGIRPPEPLTHDLLAGMFTRHGCRLVRLEITGQPGVCPYAARLVYRQGLRRHALPARVSDGLALAVRLGAPILAAEELLAAFPGLPGLLASLRQGELSRGLSFLNISAEQAQRTPTRATFN